MFRLILLPKIEFSYNLSYSNPSGVFQNMQIEDQKKGIREGEGKMIKKEGG